MGQDNFCGSCCGTRYTKTPVIQEAETKPIKIESSSEEEVFET